MAKPGKKVAQQTDAKAILAVTVGEHQDLVQVTTNGQLNKLRQIIQKLVDHLWDDYGHNWHGGYTLWHLQDKPADLEAKTRDAIASVKPYLIFTISSQAAVAARDARTAARQPTLPIIFTVVSFPQLPQNGRIPPLIDPDTGLGDQITGVSTSLVQDVLNFRDIVKGFRDRANRPWKAYYLGQESYPSTKRARKLIHDNPDPQVPVEPCELATGDDSEIRGVIGGLPQVTPAGRRTCILVAPSDVVYANRETVIEAAQGRNDPIPTFFQQLECVNPNTPDVTLSAVAARGLSADTIGGSAAWFVDKVFADQKAASSLVFASPKNFENLENKNTTFAKALDLVPTHGALNIRPTSARGARPTGGKTKAAGKKAGPGARRKGR